MAIGSCTHISVTSLHGIIYSTVVASSLDVYSEILAKTENAAPSRCREHQHLSNGVYYERIGWILTEKLR